MITKTLLLTGLFSIALFSCAQQKRNNDNKAILENIKPNIIYILADDLGYGDLSCYGQQKFKTPNIDALASKGIKFTKHYCGSAVCAPSRSSLMTGQDTGHTPIRGNLEAENGGEGQIPLPANAITIAEVLKKAGYTTGMFGKWGLGFGEGDPNKQGFDEFYGYNDQKLAHRYYPAYLNHNQTRDSLNGNDWSHKVTYSPDKIQKATLKFIEANKDKPFFIYVPSTLPHAELISPKDSIFSLYKGNFKEVPHTADENYTSDYGPNIVIREYCPQAMPYATYASMISRLDTYVGEIIKKIEELGIANNTIIMFASDNGPATEGGANPEFFNSTGGLKGVKRDLYEGGIRSPFIAVWPNHIREGIISNHVSAFWDVMPTLTEIAGIDAPTNSNGISFLPTLLEEGKQKEHDYLYWEYNIKGGRKAIRKGDWKGVIYNIDINDNNKMELYNISNDPLETTDIASKNPEIVKVLKALLKDARIESKEFPIKK